MIRILEPRIANMIAAGEVVDRPASVIKELVENAIDAKASYIHVEVFGFGMSEIKVTDNGIGMDHEDAKLAFQRHATSKIEHETDLSSIKTLGFRGEALAAIASVSKVTLVTKQKDLDGYEVIYHGGKPIREGIQKANQGTSVSVKDLFYNTPARFKFIKSEMSEKNAITDVFDKLALANPLIRMKLSMDQKVLRETFADANIYQLFSQIYGHKAIENMVDFSLSIGKTTIKGYLGSPMLSKSKKTDISVFMNGRFVRNHTLTQAVIEGYQGFIMTQRYPIALLYIEMDPSLLDVNVHPQKYEVKCMNEHMLAYQIELAIKNHLNTSGRPAPYHSIQKDDGYQPIEMILDMPILEESPLNDEKNDVDNQRPSLMDFVGSFAGTYLFFQDHEGLLVLDQHAAEERIRYESIYQGFMATRGETVRPLFPKPIGLTQQEMKNIEAFKSEFLAYGFHFNEKNEIIAHPVWLKDDDLETAIESFLNMLLDQKTINLAKYKDELAKSISCKASIKANYPISRQEAVYLLQALLKADNPHHCPHGRPTMVRLTHRDFEKLFKRIVS